MSKVGAVAGDEASYDTFAELFDGIVRRVAGWIGLRENLQETMVFTIRYRVFL
jgi:hypothetical protein